MRDPSEITNREFNQSFSMTDNNNIKEQIRKYILENTFVPAEEVQYDTLIFMQGIFDSMGFISLINFIEETFGVKAKDSELLEDNFESINAMASYIARKLN